MTSLDVIGSIRRTRAAVRPESGRTRRPARRRAPLPTRPGVGRHPRAGRGDRRSHQPPQGLRARLTDELPLALTPEVESISDDGDTVKWLWRSRRSQDRDRADALRRPHDRLRVVPGRLRDGVRLLRHRPVRLRSPPVRRRDRRTDRPCPTPIGASSRLEHRLHGDGRTIRQLRPHMGAVERINKDLGIGARHITISTVGVVPGIERLAEEDLPVNLAVSLHVANDRDRDELVPLNKRYPLIAFTRPAGATSTPRTGASPSSGPSSMVSTTETPMSTNSLTTPGHCAPTST